MATKTTLEQRIVELENRLAQVEARQAKAAAWRAKIIPAEMDEDANVQSLMAELTKNATDRWKRSLAADGVALKEARRREMVALKLKELEEQGKSEKQILAAEVEAVLIYYERHGVAPEGYEIVDDGPEPINTRLF
jgi:hypothetical protein